MAELFQHRVAEWMQACFGPEISADGQERNHRFLEEALELVQACGATRHEALALVDYVYGRPKGEPAQEVGGVLVTLAAHCQAHGIDMETSGETELARVWTKVEQIRAKQAGKPKGSPLPEEAPFEPAKRGCLTDVVAMSPDPEDRRTLILHFKHDVTQADRDRLVELHNERIGTALHLSEEKPSHG